MGLELLRLRALREQFGGAGAANPGEIEPKSGRNRADVVCFQEFLQLFIETYKSNGGPSLDPERLRKGVLLTSMENMMYMIASVPNCLTMWPGGSLWPQKGLDLKDSKGLL